MTVLVYEGLGFPNCEYQSSESPCCIGLEINQLKVKKKQSKQSKNKAVALWNVSAFIFMADRNTSPFKLTRNSPARKEENAKDFPFDETT